MREDFFEHPLAEFFRDFLFVAAGFAKGNSVQRAIAAVPLLRQKRGATKHDEKQLERMFGIGRADFTLYAADGERRRDVDFQKLFRAGACVLPVQSPDCAIGEHAPLHGPVAGDVDTRQVAQHLRGWRAEVAGFQVALTGFVAAVQLAQPAFGFDNRQTKLRTLRFASRQCVRLAMTIREKQIVGNVFAPLLAYIDLRQPCIGKAQRVQDGLDDFVFGLRFVQFRVRRT